PGTYDVFIRDANAVSCSVNLGQSEILPGGSLTATVAFTNVTCFGAADGSITITDPQNGSGSYEYSIDGGANWQASGLFTGLTPDAYAVMMRDANEVTNVANLGTVTISEPAVLTALVDKTDITCHQTTGSVTVTASGGSGIYEYRLEPGTGWQSANVFNALSSGTYDISVRDSKACEILIEGITIETISGPEIVNIEITHATNGLDDGSANIVANGVAQPLGYSLTGNGTDWQPASLFNNLSTGQYTAFVQDANGCTTSMAFDILNSVSGEVEITADTVTYCLNLPVIIPVEARDFTDISSFIMELAYNTEVLSFTGLTGVNPALENGTFSNSIVGDTLQIRFSTWDNVTTVGTGEQLFSLRFDALAPGNSDLIWNWMQCVLYSADNDSIPAIFVNGLAEILPSPAIYSEGSGTYCEGDMLTLRAGSLDDQQISFEWTGPSGFTHPEADWQLGQLGINDNGQFRLIATNPENCRATQDVEVRVNPKPQISLGYADTLCFGQQELLNPGSGYASYLWHDGSTAESRIAIEAGTYWVQVTDVNNCKASDSIHVVPCNLELLIPNAFTPNGDGLNDTFRPLFSGFEFNDFYMAIYTKWGDLVFTTTDFITGWDGTINGNPAQTDTYIYVISYEAPSYVTRTLPSPATGDITLIR
ncbi:MAG: gliding motility-associated C-terminal domain-containing protein, partial [Bacteroidales bacterium]|nr:gliding motility-associated C-terminal domain-containing protein [Bacteroidales bacterium]